MLLFLKVFLDAPLDPYDASQEDEGERRQDHEVVRNIAEPVEDVDPEERAASEEFPEEGDDQEDHAVAGAVGDTVEEGRPRLVAEGERLDAAHHDAVRDDEADVHGQLLVDGVGGFEALEDLIHQDHHHRHHHELHDDAHAARDGVPQQGQDEAGNAADDDDGERHDERTLQGDGHREGRADAQHQDGDRVPLENGVEDGFFQFCIHGLFLRIVMVVFAVLMLAFAVIVLTFAVLMLAFAVFMLAAAVMSRGGIALEILRIGGEPHVQGVGQAVGGHGSTGDGVDLVVDGFGTVGGLRGAALDDLENLRGGEVGLFAHELGLEGGIVLDLGAEAGCLGLMVEIGTSDGGVVRHEGDIAPDGTPEAGSVDGHHRVAVLEDEDGDFRIAGLVRPALDVVILALEGLGAEDLDALQLPDHVAFGVNHKGLLDLFLVLGQFFVVGEFVQFRLGAVLGGGEHLGDGFRLLIGVLASLEGLGDEGEERGYDDHDEGRVNDRIDVVVRIHFHSACPLGGFHSFGPPVDVGRDDAVVDERGHRVHEQDSEHHALHVARVPQAHQDGEGADKEAVNPLAGLGLGRGHRVGGHEDGTEQEAAHHKLVVTGKVRGAGKLAEPADKEAAGEGGDHDLPGSHAGPDKEDGAKKDGDDAGFTSGSGDETIYHVHEGILGVQGRDAAVVRDGERGSRGDRIHVLEGGDPGLGNPYGGSGHRRRIGEEQEGAGHQGRVPDVHAGAAEHFLDEDHGEGHGEGEHPQGNVHRDDERDEEAGDEVTLVHFLAADLGGAELDGEADDVRDHEQREHPQESVPEHVPEVPVEAVGEGGLQAHVVHAEQGGRDEGDHDHDHDALEVDAVADVGTFRGHGSRNAEEGVESIDGRVKPVQLAAFFEEAGFLFVCHNLCHFFNHQVDTLLDDGLDVVLGRVHVVAEGEVFRKDLVDAELLHLLDVAREAGLDEVDGEDIHRGHVLEAFGLDERAGTTMQVGVHVVLFLGREPGEVAPGGTVDFRTERFGPTEPLALRAFMQEGELVLEEAEVAVGAEGFAGKDVTADDSDIGRDGGNILDGRAREGDHVGRIVDDGSGDRHLAGEVQLAGVDYPTEGGDHQDGHRPHGFAFLDGGEVTDLHAHIAGGMLAAHGMDDGVLHLVERAAVPDRLVHGDMDTSVGQLAEGVHTGLDVGEAVAEGEFGVGRERGGAEGGDENGLRAQVGIGLDAVGTLDDRAPEAGLEEKLFHLLRIGGDLRAEVDVLLGVVGLDEDGEQLPLLTPDDAGHGAADGRRDEDPGLLLVGEDGGTGEDAVTFLHEESRKESLEISGFDGDDARFDRLDDLLGGGTLDGDVEALFQIELVGHY